MSKEFDKNRLLLEIDKTIREVNRDVINPAIPELKVDDLRPAINLVARARAAYLSEFMQLADAASDGLPTLEQIKKLRYLHQTFEELVSGMQALQAAIERRYLDVG